MNSQVPASAGRRTAYLSRDQRLQILTLHESRLSRKDIVRRLGVTISQVKSTIISGRVSPRPRSGRPALLTSAQVDELENFVRSSRQARQMSFLELALHFRLWGAGEYAIGNALKSRGYARRISRRCPPLSEDHRVARKLWCEQRQGWLQQWSHILWSDETWINDGRVTSCYITRKVGEEYDSTCITDRYKKNNSLMFWGSFLGVERGPFVFWEKEWGNITGEGYRQHVLPKVVSWLREKTGRTGLAYNFMQDNAPAHTAGPTLAYLNANGVDLMPWPALSPDLNPIENIWSMMKVHIHTRYPEFRREGQRSRPDVRRIVEEAWYDCTTEHKLMELIKSMPKRCQDVLDANGGPISY